MDWKELLNQKVAEGVLPHEENTNDSLPPVSDNHKTDTLNVILDKKGRKGKVATLIVGFTCSDSELKEFAAAIKSRLGTGGSARGGEILIQGDRVNDVKQFLKNAGYKVK